MRWDQWKVGLCTGLASALLLLPAATAQSQTGALPGPEDLSPTPSGRFPVGRTAFHWVDQSRAELETKDPADRREMVVHLFYPAGKIGRTAAYIPDGDLMRGTWRDATDRLIRLRAHTTLDAPVAGRGRYPVLVFAPGGAQKALSYTALLEELASRGFVIAALELPHNAPAMRFPDGRVLVRAAPADRGWPPERTRDEHTLVYARQVEHWARDISFVIDRLASLNQSDPRFSRRLDMGRVGAFGHSKGGAAAGVVRLIDSRVRGGVNIDGADLGRPFSPFRSGVGGDQPFLWITKPFPQPTAEQLQQAGMTEADFNGYLSEGERLLGGMRGGAAHLVVSQPGLEHLDFGDYGLWTTASDPAARARKLRVLAITADYVEAFFDGALNRDWRRYRRISLDTTAYPEVQARAFGRRW